MGTEGRMGFIGGFVVSLWNSISLHSVIETCLYASIGAVVSFCVSYLLRRLVKKLTSK